MFWWDAKEQRKGGNGKQINTGKMDKMRSVLGLQMNSSIPFLKAVLMKMKTLLFSTLITVRQSWSYIKDAVKHLRQFSHKNT